MKSLKYSRAKPRFTAALFSLCLAALIYWSSLPFVMARQTETPQKPGPDSTDTNAPPASATDTNAPAAKPAKKSPDDLIQLSFQGANIDMVVQWLAETTDKSVVKHPQVQCQLTIVGSKKISRQEAITLVYRALALEGFAAVESSKSILIVPEGKEPKTSPEMIEGAQTGVPGSRELLVKVFSLQHAQAAMLKDKVKSVLTEKATIEIDEHANALIITDYNDNVAVAGQLISALDTDKPQDVTVRVIPVKNANAQDLARELEPFYATKPGGRENKEALQISANERSNSLMVYSSESDFKTIEQLVGTLDTEEAQEKVMRSFVLKNADAADVARQLQDLYKEGGTGNSRYAFYYYNSSQSDNNNTKQLSVATDRRRNAIIVQAPPLRMDSIAKMVEALDEPLDDASLAPRIYLLKYVSAADIEDVLNELFLKKTQQRSYWFDEEPQETADRDVGRLYGKVRITSEPYSNAIIIAANSAESLAAVEEVLRQLDVPSQAGETTFRLGLRFADASILANSVNILFAKGGSPAMHQQANNNPNQPNQQQQQQQGQGQQTESQSNFEITQQTKEESYYPWLGGQPDNPRSANDTRAQRPVSDLIGRVRVVPDARSNSLLISANVHFFPQVMKLIEEMDVPTAEVMIEARIVEVSSDFLDQLGVRWSPDGTASFTANDNDNSLVASTTGQYQAGFGGKTAVNNPPTSAASTFASALSSLRSGMVNNTISMDFLIQFLHERTDAVVLADPHLEIGDNELGKLFVGQQVPISTGAVNPSVGGSSTSIAYQDVGVILEVEPHINDSGDVTLRIRTESSTVSTTLGLTGSPIFNTANFRTQLTATNGQTLILGGIIQKQSTLTMRKTPVLGSIPGLKWAFNKKDNSDQRTELLVFLRPKVTRTPQEARALLEEVNKKTPLIENWEETEAAKRDRTPKTPPAGP
jgi:type II secretion system protein D